MGKQLNSLRMMISSSAVQNIIKRFRESEKIPVHEQQGQKPILNGCDLSALRRPYIKISVEDWVLRVAVCAQEHPFNTIHCIHQ